MFLLFAGYVLIAQTLTFWLGIIWVLAAFFAAVRSAPLHAR